MGELQRNSNKITPNDNIKVYGCSRKKFSFKHKNYYHKTLDASDQKSVSKWFKEIFTKEKNRYFDLFSWVYKRW